MNFPSPFSIKSTNLFETREGAKGKTERKRGGESERERKREKTSPKLLVHLMERPVAQEKSHRR